MEEAAQGRAAGVRIGVSSVLVKDRYRNECDAESNVSDGEAHSKNVASESALRRINRKSNDAWIFASNQNLGGLSGGVYGTLPSP